MIPSASTQLWIVVAGAENEMLQSSKNDQINGLHGIMVKGGSVEQPPAPVPLTPALSPGHACGRQEVGERRPERLMIRPVGLCRQAGLNEGATLGFAVHKTRACGPSATVRRS